MASTRRPSVARARQALLRAALGYPDAHLDHPWGEDVVKVRAKVFVFLGQEADRLYVTVKLPTSNMLALAQPFAEPSGYGLGRAGWVTSAFDPGDAVPVDLLREWIDESYRAVAPRTLVARLGTQPG